LRDFEAAGDLTIVQDESADDVQQVVELVCRVDASGLLAAKDSIGLDPERTTIVVRKALLEAGIGEEQVVGIPQGWRLDSAITIAERKLAERALVRRIDAHEDLKRDLEAGDVGERHFLEDFQRRKLLAWRDDGSRRIKKSCASCSAPSRARTRPGERGKNDAH
jgi:hypothetical protein